MREATIRCSFDIAELTTDFIVLKALGQLLVYVICHYTFFNMTMKLFELTNKSRLT